MIRHTGEQKAKVVLSRFGGNSRSRSYSCRVTLPRHWVDDMGITPDDRDVLLTYNGDEIIVTRPDARPHKPLASKREIWLFATFWAKLFSASDSLPFSLVDEVYFGDALHALGFEMDSGESYRKAFSETEVPEVAKLRRQLPMMDVRVLGNLIFSVWRLWTHWVMPPSQEIVGLWFTMALTRLAELTSDDS